MIVYINKSKIDIFQGARVKDAILAYSRRSYQLFMRERLIALDRFGNLTDAEGALVNEQMITLKRNIR